MASDEGGPPQASVNELVSILHEGLAAKGYTVVDNEGKADLTMTLSYHGGAAASQPVQASTDKVAGASFILSLKDGTQKRIWTATIAAESAQVLARDALNEIPVKTKEN